MPHSYASNIVHIVFSTHNRARFIRDDIKPELLSYVTGVVQNLGSTMIRNNAIEDHGHFLVALKSTTALAELIGKMKSNSSRFVHEQWPRMRNFDWQEGYGAFSVSRSRVDAVVAYIDNQVEHHKRQSFEDEFRALLEAHAVPYDERYVFG